MTSPEQNPETPATAPAGEEDAAPSGAYRNLWMPLVVVPAGIVIVAMLLVVLLGEVTGEERNLSENLEIVLAGGANQRDQATFSLVRQLQENRLAKLEEREIPWPVDPGFADDLRKAWDTLAPEDVTTRMVIAASLAQIDTGEGVDRLLTLLDVPEEVDPEGEARFHVLYHLMTSGDPRAGARFVATLAHADPGLRAMAAIGLQRFPGEGTLVALSNALADPEFEVRANAAISLSHHGDPRGAALLVDMLDPAIYSGENERNAEKFVRGDDISRSRVVAIEALARLGRPQDRSRVQSLADSASDLVVREAAMRAVEGWNADSE